MDDSKQDKDQAVLQVLASTRPEAALKALLTLKNISQMELSQKLGITRSEISRVISGKRRTRRVRNAIAQELGVPVHVLFGPIDDAKRAEAGQGGGT